MSVSVEVEVAGRGARFIPKNDSKYNSNNDNKGKVTILWNQQVQTNRTIPNKNPDMIMKREHVC